MSRYDNIIGSSDGCTIEECLCSGFGPLQKKYRGITDQSDETLKVIRLVTADIISYYRSPTAANPNGIEIPINMNIMKNVIELAKKIETLNPTITQDQLYMVIYNALKPYPRTHTKQFTKRLDYFKKLRTTIKSKLAFKKMRKRDEEKDLNLPHNGNSEYVLERRTIILPDINNMSCGPY